MNTQQQRQLAWEAFKAGVENGGDSSPVDSDYLEIQEFIKIAFEAWWKRYRENRRRP